MGYRLKPPWGYQRAMLCRIVIYIYLFCLLTIKILGLSKWRKTEEAKKTTVWKNRYIYKYEKRISFSAELQASLFSNRGLHQAPSFSSVAKFIWQSMRSQPSGSSPFREHGPKVEEIRKGEYSWVMERTIY